MISAALMLARRITAHHAVLVTLHQMGMEAYWHMAKNSVNPLLDSRGPMPVEDLKDSRPKAAHSAKSGLVVVKEEVGSLVG